MGLFMGRWLNKVITRNTLNGAITTENVHLVAAFQRIYPTISPYSGGLGKDNKNLRKKSTT
jgi:hypothetical protein